MRFFFELLENCYTNNDVLTSTVHKIEHNTDVK